MCPLFGWQKVIDVDLTCTFLCCRAVGPSMIENRRVCLTAVPKHAGVSELNLTFGAASGLRSGRVVAPPPDGLARER